MIDLTVNGEPIRYDLVPVSYMQDGVRNYLEQGIPGGSFLQAVIEGDLFGACGNADDTNRHHLFEWCFWFYNYAPRGSFGSPENAAHWMEHRRNARQERIAQ